MLPSNIAHAAHNLPSMMAKRRASGLSIGSGFFIAFTPIWGTVAIAYPTRGGQVEGTVN